jgi:AcrR family transcriptional regulator
MTRMSADARRAELLEAAIRVMTRDGVARATTRAIAAEAGMPLGVFHYAFRSKHELMVWVVETIASRSRTDIDAVVLAADRPTELRDVVFAGLFAYFDHVVEDPHAHLVTYELTTSMLRDPELEGVAGKQYDYYLQENEKLLRTAADLLGVEFVHPLPVVSRFLFSVMDGLVLNYLARGDEEEARRVVELTADTLLTMVRPR